MINRDRLTVEKIGLAAAGHANPKQPPDAQSTDEFEMSVENIVLWLCICLSEGEWVNEEHTGRHANQQPKPGRARTGGRCCTS